MILRVLPFYSSLIFFLLWFVGVTFQGYYLYTGLFLAFVLIPILDIVFGINSHNENEEVYLNIKNKLWIFDIVFYLYLVLHCSMLFYGPWIALKNNFSTWDWVLTVTTTGLITGGFGITIAHELCHRSNKWHQFLADFLLSSVSYMHFSTEHVYGHHLKVSTPEDPASARFNESFYQFYPRTLIGSFKSAWEIEAKKRLGRGLRVWGFGNKIIIGLFVSLSWAFIFGILFGKMGVLFFLGQSLVAFSLLELVNYTEHYGLERKRLDNGRYEKVRPIHSWNSSHRLSNWYLFNLERHSDHHAFANRPYPLLRHHFDAPQLPSGYDTMIMLALIPHLWFRIMNPKVLVFNNQKIED